jgi:hypothetical protein
MGRTFPGWVCKFPPYVAHQQVNNDVGSIFYFGYLAGQFPSGYLMQRLPVGRVVSATVVIWGGIVLTVSCMP